jgi:hypothetical protein
MNIPIEYAEPGDSESIVELIKGNSYGKWDLSDIRDSRACPSSYKKVLTDIINNHEILSSEIDSFDCRYEG